MLRESRCATNSSEKVGSSWSNRITLDFSNLMIKDSSIEVAVDIRSTWCAKHPSPKKSLTPKMATTASLPW